MVMTVLEARVARENWQVLVDTYSRETQVLDPGIVQTFLVHSRGDDSIWQIITIWENQEALTVMRQSNETPRGVLIFRSAQAQPVLNIQDIVSQAPEKS